MNGCADLWDYGGIHTPPTMMIIANLKDSPGIAEKWEIDLPDLIRRLRKMSPAEGEAILAAVRWLWDHCDEIGSSVDEWWKIGFRAQRGDVD